MTKIRLFRDFAQAIRLLACATRNNDKMGILYARGEYAAVLRTLRGEDPAAEVPGFHYRPAGGWWSDNEDGLNVCRKPGDSLWVAKFNDDDVFGSGRTPFAALMSLASELGNCRWIAEMAAGDIIRWGGNKETNDGK